MANKKLEENMEEGAKRVKGFFAEFKTFITRGNVLDMSVGVIVGGQHRIKIQSRPAAENRKLTARDHVPHYTLRHFNVIRTRKYFLRIYNVYHMMRHRRHFLNSWLGCAYIHTAIYLHRIARYYLTVKSLCYFHGKSTFATCRRTNYSIYLYFIVVGSNKTAYNLTYITGRPY